MIRPSLLLLVALGEYMMLTQLKPCTAGGIHVIDETFGPMSSNRRHGEQTEGICCTVSRHASLSTRIISGQNMHISEFAEYEPTIQKQRSSQEATDEPCFIHTRTRLYLLNKHG